MSSLEIDARPLTRRESQQRGSTDSSNRATIPPSKASSSPVEKPKDHFTAIDGARGIAILSVLLYHSGWSERGLFGVDMFFVISGFLITFILVREVRNTGRIRIGAFYARRAKRLLPPLVITLTGVLLMLWQYGTLSELRSASNTALASLMQIANWQQIGSNAAYWEATGQVIPLGQMWSLSATEQFYVVWPVLLLVLWFASRKRTGALAIWLTAVLIVSALVSPALFDGANIDRLYLGTDSRAISFVAGGLFAALTAWAIQKGPRWAGATPSPSSRVMLTSISAISLAGVVTASVMTMSYREPWLYQGGIAVVSVLIALFIATLAFPANALTRPFSWKPFRLFGVLAYGLFLLHLPVFWAWQHFTHGSLHPLALFGLGTLSTWLLASFLHYWITEPLRVRRWNSKQAIIAIAVSFGLVAGLSFLLPAQREKSPHPVTTTSSGVSAEGFFPADVDRVLPLAADGGPLRIALIGDSISSNIYTAITDFGSNRLDAVDASYGGCGIFDTDRVRAPDGWVFSETKAICWPWQQKLRDAETERHVDIYLLHNRYDVHDQFYEGAWITPADPAWAERYRSQLEGLIAIGNESGNPPLILLANDHPTSTTPAERLDALAKVNAEVAQQHPNVTLLDFASAKCPQGACPTKDIDGQPLYVDGVHFAAAGQALMEPWLETEIARALSTDK